MAEDNNVSSMRPEMGDTNISLPMTLDYSNGRGEKEKTKRITAIISSAITLILSIAFLFNKMSAFHVRLCVSAGLILIMQFIIRFIILKESRIKKSYKQLVDTNYELSSSAIWGIYTIENEYPYYCRFKNGRSGVFVRLNKDVILGKYSEAEFNHYEAISDAYNLAGGSKVQICHIDYMVNVGTDERLEHSFESLSEMSNPDLKDLLMDIFSYQQEQMMRKVTTYDTYLFLWSGSDINGWATVQKILSCFLDANYRSYYILDEDDIRDLVKVLFNLHDFSIVDASMGVFNNEISRGIVPIEIRKDNGEVVKLNKTVEEKREEQRILEEQKAAEEAEKKRRKSRKDKKQKDEEEYDIFS